jgi:hypothetical protein
LADRLADKPPTGFCNEPLLINLSSVELSSPELMLNTPVCILQKERARYGLEKKGFDEPERFKT